MNTLWTLWSLLLATALFAGMLLMLVVGQRVGERFEATDPDGAHTGTGAVEGAIFALFGLLVAFTFSGASARFDTRRNLIVEEANAIGTAHLRLDLLPPAAQPGLRALFGRYLDARLATYRRIPDLDAARAEVVHAEKLQTEIWSAALTAAADGDRPSATMLLLPALNAMFDIASTRLAATEMHPPFVVYALLFGLGLGCAGLAGYSMAQGRKRKWPHMIAFAAIVAVTVYVILDLEYPRLGMIRVDAFDRLLEDLRQRMP